MKNKNINGNQEFEKLLKDKMNALSESVDCFEKISARAFPEKSSDFSDSELIVSDLENVTGKRRGLPWLKWAAVAAALVLCIGVLPQTAFVNNFFANLGKSSNKLYRSIISEIAEETENHDYRVYDVTLEEYIAYDLLITPLYDCPFEDMGRDDMKVRIYIREHDSMLTNQVYAVEYSGAYTESNFVAVAESGAKFTDKELEAFTIDEEYTFNEDTDTAGAIFSSLGLEEKGIAYGTAATFVYSCICKFEGSIYPIFDHVLYYNNCNVNEDDELCYHYDMACYGCDGEEILIGDTYGSKLQWKNSVYFGGNSALPEESASLFERELLFVDAPDIYTPYWAYVEPYAQESGSDRLETPTLYFVEGSSERVIGSICTLYDNIERRSMKIFIAPEMIWASSYSDPQIRVEDDQMMSTFAAWGDVVFSDIIDYDDSADEAEQAALEAEQAQIAENVKAQSEQAAYEEYLRCQTQYEKAAEYAQELREKGFDEEARNAEDMAEELEALVEQASIAYEEMHTNQNYRN